MVPDVSRGVLPPIRRFGASETKEAICKSPGAFSLLETS